MTISYATAPLSGSQQHTGTQVRIAAGGPQAANVLGVTDQTELFYPMSRALGLKR
jgi:alkaline phosphatase